MLSKQQVREGVVLKGEGSLAITQSNLNRVHEKTEEQGAKGISPQINTDDDRHSLNRLYTCAGDAFCLFFLSSTLGRREICLSVAVKLSFPPEGGMEGHEREKDNPLKGEERLGHVRMTPQTLPCSSLWENP